MPTDLKFENEMHIRDVCSKCYRENGNVCMAQGANCSVGYGTSKADLDEESRLYQKIIVVSR